MPEEDNKKVFYVVKDGAWVPINAKDYISPYSQLPAPKPSQKKLKKKALKKQ